MTIKKKENGWLVDIQPGGRGSKRYRKTLPTKAEAMRYEAWLKNKVSQSPEWEPPKRDLRRLSDLISIWHEHHGQHLKSRDKTLNSLQNLCKALGNPIADNIKAEDFTEYRKKRIAEGLAPNSLNREQAYARSMFNELIRLKIWKQENPLAGVRQLKIEEKELAYLTNDEIRRLLAELEKGRNQDALIITKICLAIGARWNEAERLRISQVRDGQIHLSGTKSGKNRSIPISKRLQDELKPLITGSKTGRLFKYAYSAFRDAVERSGLNLPPGQLTHVLRHTFASHFMMNGGNILTLQRILGHSTLVMTMRYAHLAPDHLQEATSLNPLERLTLG